MSLPLPALLRTAARAIERFMVHKGRPLSLTARQIDVLVLLDECPGISSAEIARRISMSRESMSHLMRRLLARGLIKHTRLNKKTYQNWLTPQGVEKLAACREIHADVAEAVEAIAAARKSFADKLIAISDMHQ